MGEPPAYERHSLFFGFWGGETIDEFIRLYPPISREQVLAVLDFANHQLLECAPH
jgi:hypothetical protein